MTRHLEEIEAEIERRWLDLTGEAATYAKRRLSVEASNRVADHIEEKGLSKCPALPDSWRQWWADFLETVDRCEADGTIPSDLPDPPPWDPELWKTAAQWAESGRYPVAVFALAVAYVLTHEDPIL